MFFDFCFKLLNDEGQGQCSVKLETNAITKQCSPAAITSTASAPVCVACIHRWTSHSLDFRRRNNATCPFCRAALSNESLLNLASSEIIALQKDLDRLLVLCPFGKLVESLHSTSANSTPCAWIGPRENLNAHIVADCVSARFHFPEQEQLEDLVGIMNPADNIAECMHPFCIRAREMAAERQQCQQLQLNARRNIQMQYLPRRYVVPIMLANVLEDWGIHVPRNAAVAAVDDLDPDMDMEFRDFQQHFLEVRYFRQVLLNLALFATYLMVLMFDCFFVNCRFKSAMTAFLSAIKLFPQQSHLLRAFLSHTSAESETQIAIDTIESSLGVENGELTPMLDIGCRLGEGSGAALVYPILKAAGWGSM
ncbi:UNVERIFIED_CONTAM: hypothetical protein HDU68_010409 [Siphonaria sp. JEL0065]|nr:hypothetical protein HDU68_010409 [Siphonaria sp. JEL0065]